MRKRILAVVLDDVLESAFGVTADILEAANRIMAIRGSGEPLEVKIAGPLRRVRGSSGRYIATDAIFAEAPRADVVVMMSLNVPLRAELEAALERPDVKAARKFVANQYRRGALVCASCSATFVLAETGLLDGCAATTSWWLAPLFRQRYPRVDLHEDAVIVPASNRIVTAGAALSQIDLMLWLVRRICGPEVAQLCARYLVADERTSQSRYALVNQVAHESDEVLLAERFVRRNLHRSISLAELARAARVSTRTLTRRLHEALGLAPLRFVQPLKVERAAHLLGTTRLAFDEVARRVGYEDPGALRRLLRRELGATARDLRS